MYKTQKDILDRIEQSNLKAFSTYDFLDLGNYKSISKDLELLEDEGHLKRARRGIYYKPSFNKTLGIECPPSINDIAEAIARQYNWDIIPSGNHALNLIGISTQVPSKIIYISNGPYREYDVGANKIIFKHSTTREISSISKRILISIQALKEIGKENVTDRQLKMINRFLDSKDKEIISSGIRTTSWIYDALRRSICIQ